MLDDLQIREALNLKTKERFTLLAENPQEIELLGGKSLERNLNIKEI